MSPSRKAFKRTAARRATQDEAAEPGAERRKPRPPPRTQAGTRPGTKSPSSRSESARQRAGLRKRAGTARTERTRARILRAAGRCFAERGVKTTVEEIAQSAGVSKALVYTYFDGKETLLRWLLDRTLRDWSAHNWGEVERLAPESALDGLAVMHRASIDFARQHPVLRTILVRDERLPLSDTDEPLRLGTERWRARLLDLVARGIGRGELRSELDPGRTADVIRLWHLAFLDRLYAESLIDVTDPELIEASIEVMQRGLAKAT